MSPSETPRKTGIPKGYLLMKRMIRRQTKKIVQKGIKIFFGMIKIKQLMKLFLTC